MDRKFFILAIIVMVAQSAAAAELPTSATLIDPDLVWDKSQTLIAHVSPDGKSIAYISKGAIWMSSVAGGPPSKLADLPNTMTEFLARPEFGEARGDQRKIFLSLGNQTFNSILRTLTPVDGFQWTRSQDGVR